MYSRGPKGIRSESCARSGRKALRTTRLWRSWRTNPVISRVLIRSPLEIPAAISVCPKPVRLLPRIQIVCDLLFRFPPQSIIVNSPHTRLSTCQPDDDSSADDRDRGCRVRAPSIRPGLHGMQEAQEQMRWNAPRVRLLQEAQIELRIPSTSQTRQRQRPVSSFRII